MQLPADLAKDQEVVLSRVLNLLSGCVDVLSSEGHLNAMNAMEMSQMVVQAMWDRDSPLKQIPYFGPDLVRAANEAGVKDILEFMDAMVDDAMRDSLLKALNLNQRQLADIANFTNNKYPNIDMEHELEEDDVTAGSPAYIRVKIERDVDEDDEVDTTVHAPFYAGTKMENWWIVVGEEESKSLLAIKRITIQRRLDVRLEYVVPSPGRKRLTLSLMSDSYVGVDQEQQFQVDVAEGMDEDEDEGE